MPRVSHQHWAAFPGGSRPWLCRGALDPSHPFLFVAVVGTRGLAAGELAAGGAGFHDLLLEFLGQFWVFLEVNPGLLFALAELHVAVANPRAGAGDDLLLEAHV